MTTNDLGVAIRRIFAVSIISTMKVLWSANKLSADPTRVKIASTTPSAA